MQLNEAFRYSLLHRRIIHTTLLFHRAFPVTNRSWLSCIHNNLWNGSWIVINSSFQSLVIHKITCIHLNAFNIPCPLHIWYITIINIINIYRHDIFLRSNVHMVWGLLPLPIHGICHKQTLTWMSRTYTLDMTNLVGPLQEIAKFAHQLLLWTCCLIPFFIGLLVTFISISNIFS